MVSGSHDLQNPDVRLSVLGIEPPANTAITESVPSGCAGAVARLARVQAAPIPAGIRRRRLWLKLFDVGSAESPVHGLISDHRRQPWATEH